MNHPEYNQLSPLAKALYDYSPIGFSPEKETAEEARIRYAQLAEKAYLEAIKSGIYFDWSHDGYDSSEWKDDGPFYPTWQCFAYQFREGESSLLIGYIGGVDFEEDSPKGNRANCAYSTAEEAALVIDWYREQIDEKDDHV